MRAIGMTAWTDVRLDVSNQHRSLFRTIRLPKFQSFAGGALFCACKEDRATNVCDIVRAADGASQTHGAGRGAVALPEHRTDFAPCRKDQFPIEIELRLDLCRVS